MYLLIETDSSAIFSYRTVYVVESVKEQGKNMEHYPSKYEEIQRN